MTVFRSTSTLPWVGFVMCSKRLPNVEFEECTNIIQGIAWKIVIISMRVLWTIVRENLDVTTTYVIVCLGFEPDKALCFR